MAKDGIQAQGAAGGRPAVPQQNGILVLRKPRGPSSAWCLGRIRRELGQSKIGHAGTLDPMAEGVLVVLLGQATKLSAFLMDADSRKVYSGSILLGVTTDTWDAEGRVLSRSPAEHITRAELDGAFASLRGVTEQDVPAFSAAKHEGRPLYALARKGVPVPVKKKTVTVFSVEAELVGPAHIRFRVVCTSGTYIRSLAHSLGNRLGCGAVLTELVREYSHPYPLSAAHSLEEVLREPEGFALKVTGMAGALPHWPRVPLGPEEAGLARQGRPLAHDPARLAEEYSAPGNRLLLLAPAGDPLALARIVHKDGALWWTVTRGLWNQEP
ncbi:MAG: tRNA pseudouridine(55) synthase TruB [Desulfovibrio sp.]|jgi:tRNA pseudouridine55 synthase|nr:tRNA pseudouridine(55) synthase TruB [Desulfovibrio sp.]